MDWISAEGRIAEAIKRGFLELDEQMMNDEETRQEMSGTTAITTLIKDKIIYCGNVGDSRAVSKNACGPHATKQITPYHVSGRMCE